MFTLKRKDDAGRGTKDVGQEVTARAFKQSPTTKRSLDPRGVWLSRAKLVKRPGLENDGWCYERTEAPAAVHNAMR